MSFLPILVTILIYLVTSLTIIVTIQSILVIILSSLKTMLTFLVTDYILVTIWNIRLTTLTLLTYLPFNVSYSYKNLDELHELD